MLLLLPLFLLLQLHPTEHEGELVAPFRFEPLLLALVRLGPLGAVCLAAVGDVLVEGGVVAAFALPLAQRQVGEVGEDTTPAHSLPTGRGAGDLVAARRREPHAADPALASSHSEIGACHGYILANCAIRDKCLARAAYRSPCLEDSRPHSGFLRAMGIDDRRDPRSSVAPEPPTRCNGAAAPRPATDAPSGAFPRPVG